MAKKAKKAKAAKKAAPPRKAKAAKKTKWTSPGATARATAAKRETKTPEQPALIKGLRIKSLDNICGHISDTRAAIARLQQEEADLELQAHKLLVKHDQMSWQFAGVAILRKPGEETLIVKTVRSRGPAPAAQPETDDEATAIGQGVTQTPERTDAVEGAGSADDAGGDNPFGD